MKKYFTQIKYLLLFVIIYIPIFGFLNDKPIRVWDEARLAQSAFEMSNNNNWLVVYFNNQPEMWSTKPPFMIWCQTICMKILGVNELAVRLPSALAAFFTCVLLLYVSTKYLKKAWLGIISVLILIATNGYIDNHATRTGDYDAPLTLFITAYCLLFFVYTETKRKKHLYMFFICLTLAVLTKGVAGLMFLPAVFLFALFFKEILSLLKNKHLYFGLGIFLFFTLGYYFLREQYNPGYLNAVSENELGGRFNEVNESHTGDFWFYYNAITKYFLADWFLLLPCGAIIGLVHKDKLLLKYATIICLSFITFYVLISVAATKLEWYAIPLYPFSAVIIGFFVFFIFNYLNEINIAKNILKLNVLPFVFLFLFFINPYIKIFNKTYKPQEYEWDKDFYDVSYFFKEAIAGKYNLQNHYYIHNSYAAHNDFYLEMLRQKGIKISYKKYDNLSEGDKVVVNENQVKEFVKTKYDVTEIYSRNTVSIYQIGKLKN